VRNELLILLKSRYSNFISIYFGLIQSVKEKKSLVKGNQGDPGLDKKRGGKY